MQMSHVAKIVATGTGVALCAVEVWLNAEHIAHIEGWGSSLVAATIAASISAAASLPLAERAAKAGQTAKAAGLVAFFLLMVSFSFTASVARVGGKHDGEVNAAEGSNAKAKLADEAYRDAKQGAAEACTDKTRGSTACRKATTKLDKARSALAEAPAPKTVDSMADRIAAVLPVTKQQVQTFQPLLLPLGLQIGGFILLALGLAPGKSESDAWDELPVKEEPVKITTEAEAYRWLIGQIHQAPKRQLSKSGRAMAAQLGIPPSTLAKWIERWVAEKKVAKTQSGNTTVFSMPKIRRVA
jgi:hypothetical protein